MDKKKIIQIIVIVVAFGGSGLVLYNGLGKGSSAPAVSTTAVVAPASSPVAGGAANQLLPFGGSLDFKDSIDSRGFQFDAIAFPALDTSTDVGIYDTTTQTYLEPLIQTQSAPPVSGK